MKVWVIYRDGREVGRFLARDEVHALKQARAAWGPGSYTARRVKK